MEQQSRPSGVHGHLELRQQSITDQTTLTWKNRLRTHPG